MFIRPVFVGSHAKPARGPKLLRSPRVVAGEWNVAEVEAHLQLMAPAPTLQQVRQIVLDLPPFFRPHLAVAATHLQRGIVEARRAYAKTRLRKIARVEFGTGVRQLDL